MISVVCPFYNESAILEKAINGMLQNLSTLQANWELVIVNDGSTDDSLATARAMEASHDHLRVISYSRNRGRGHALRTGINAAKGHYIITTEIDLSWGNDIVHRLVRALDESPQSQIIVASPHLPGGGYRNVPTHRVFLSRFGNLLIRAGMSFVITMNTGMTRGYRKEAIQSLPLFEDGKEFHLEVILKALAMGMNIEEIPAVLEWKDAKLAATPKTTRKSSSKIWKLVGSHLLFSVFAAPIRYLWVFCTLALGSGVATAVYAFARFLLDEPYANAILGTVAFLILSLLLFVFGVVSQQNKLLMTEIWRLQRGIRVVGHDETPE